MHTRKTSTDETAIVFLASAIKFSYKRKRLENTSTLSD